MEGKNLKAKNNVQKEILNAFSRALSREQHFLKRYPGFFWQQLYNRLQWEGEAVAQSIAPNLDQRMDQGNQPWIRTRTPFRESQSLVMTLSGHSEGINSCDYNPEGSRIISASDDGSLILWDAYTGQILRTFTGHTKAVNTCAFSPDGCHVLSGSWDKTLKIWGAEI